jgi:hypothetical protein
MTRADKVVLVLSLLGLISLYAHLWGDHGAADEIIVTAARGTQTFSIYRDRRIVVDGPRGRSTIEVRKARARFIASPCNSKLCIHAGWLIRAGDTAACLPNGVIVSLTGRDGSYDSINF